MLLRAGNIEAIINVTVKIKKKKKGKSTLHNCKMVVDPRADNYTAVSDLDYYL